MIFNEVYGSYYNVIAGILQEAVSGTMTPAKMRQIIEEKAFLESGLSIPKALRDGSWPFLSGDGSTPVRHVPTMPLTLLEKQWLKAILADPRIRLFDPPETGLEDVEPLFAPDFFVYYDRYGDGDPYEDPAYQEHFRLCLTALKTGRGIRVRYEGKSGSHEQDLIPDRLEYSLKDDKFRLLTHTAKGTPMVINLARIRACAFTEVLPEGRKQPPDKREVIFLLTDERNALERAMIHFSDLEKETVRLDERHYRVTLRYRGEDETEILIRILAFGPVIRVTGPETFTALVKARLQRQRELLG